MVSLPIAAALLAITGVGDTVLLDFSSEYCGPCKQMEPIVGQLAASGFPIRKIDIAREPELANRHGVSGVPTFIMLADGQEVDRVVGATTSERLQAMLQKANQVARPSAQPPTTAQQPQSEKLPITPTDQPWDSAQSVSQRSLLRDEQNSRPQAPEAPTLPDRLIEATARIKIVDGGGNSVGTGTIIDSRAGEALILTCAHIFRDSQGKGQIVVDLFGPGAPKNLAAELIDYDLKSDVGLISVRTVHPVTLAHVAPRSSSLRPGDTVFSVGCNHGEDPTIRQSKVTSLDKYVGPPNVQVAGQPVQGRSGGGLFNAEGLIVGVCNAADSIDNEGLYAGLPSVHAALDRRSLTYVYHPAAPGDLDRGVALPTSHPTGAEQVPMAPIQSRQPQNAGPTTTIPAAREVVSQLSQQEQATLAALHGQSQDAEVVIIIRPRGNPQAKSEVIVVDSASAAFRERLLMAGAARK